MSDSLTILQGDCLESLKTLANESAQCCVTSPPYWGLRSYLPEGHSLKAFEIGTEKTPAEYVAKLVAVFEGVRRVLREDGTLWLNLGDSYASVGKWGGSSGGKHVSELHGDSGVGRGRRDFGTGLKSKDLVGIPWMVAFALRSAGWYLRQDIIWAKPNPMPESVTDRCTKSHEYLFLLSKSERYFFDHEAIKEPVAASSISRLSQATLSQQVGSDRVPGKTNGRMKAVGGKETRNKRDIWNVTTKGFKGAHFATFPPALITPCVLAGSKSGDTVLDPFGGSGTTGEVSLELGRKAILCELNPDYLPLINQRCNPTLPGNGETISND